MSATERKFWPAIKKHEHVLGEVRKVAHGEGTISALYLYEQSVERGAEPAELPKARISVMIGACSGIICTVCGQPVNWVEPPSEAYERLFTRYQKDE